MDDGVGVDEQLSGAGDEGCGVGFAAAGEAGVEGDQRLVPAEGGRQGGGEQRAAQAGASAGDVALTLVRSAVVVERRQAGEGGDLLAADFAEFRHADDEGDRRPLARCE